MEGGKEERGGGGGGGEKKFGRIQQTGQIYDPVLESSGRHDRRSLGGPTEAVDFTRASDTEGEIPLGGFFGWSFWFAWTSPPGSWSGAWEHPLMSASFPPCHGIEELLAGS